MSEPLTFTLPAELVESVARRVAELLHKDDRDREALGLGWLDFEAARTYLGFSRDTLYKLTAARAIPCRKKTGGQGLRFHRDELDAWMEIHYPRLDRAR
jgi:excisionase family DNA binding protein